MRLGTTLVFLLLAACRQREAAPPPLLDAAVAVAADAAPAPDALVLPPTPDLPPPEVRVLDAGSGKKVPLRYVWPAGTTGRLAIEVDSRTEITLAHSRVSNTKLPALRYVVETRVESVEADGAMMLSLVVVEVTGVNVTGVLPQVLADFNASLATVAGSRGTTRLDARGLLTGTDITAPATAHRDAREALRALGSTLDDVILPLPEEPVGHGARWQVKRSRYVSGRLLVEETVRIELETRREDELVVGLKATQSAGPQTIVGADAGAASVRIDALDGTGKGERTLSLTHPLGVVGKLDRKVKTSGAMVEEGANTPLSTEARIRVTTAPP